MASPPIISAVQSCDKRTEHTRPSSRPTIQHSAAQQPPSKLLASQVKHSGPSGPLSPMQLPRRKLRAWACFMTAMEQLVSSPNVTHLTTSHRSKAAAAKRWSLSNRPMLLLQQCQSGVLPLMPLWHGMPSKAKGLNQAINSSSTSGLQAIAMPAAASVPLTTY
jgi:hypothetical protein